MNNLKDYRYPLLFLILFVGLAIAFRSFVISYIIEPIAMLFWLAWRVISTVNQNIYWLILIAVCFMIMLRIVPAPKRGIRHAYRYKYAARNRVEHWQVLLSNSALGENESAFLRENLEKLIYSVLALSQESTSTNLRQRVAEGQARLPPAVKHFLFPPQEKQKLLSRFGQGCTRHLLPGWLHRRMKRFVTPDTTSIDEILAWMEHDLEIKHEP